MYKYIKSIKKLANHQIPVIKMQKINRVLIAGGGVGGLTLAKCLQKLGKQPIILESHSALKFISNSNLSGSGIGIWINALRVMKQLNLFDELSQNGKMMASAGYRIQKGDWLSGHSKFTIEHKNPVLCLHRKDLYQTLMNSLSEDTIQWNSKVEKFEILKNSVIVHLENGKQIEGDVLVGADGIHSTIRNQLYSTYFTEEPIKPEYCGYTYYRGLLNLNEEKTKSFGASFETWGIGKRFAYVPLKDPQAFWFGAFKNNDLKNTPKDPIEMKKHCISLFNDYHDPIPYLIEETSENDLIRTDIYQIPKMKNWGHDRVFLLGDACHALAPNLAQGACLAIEDASELAFLLNSDLSMNEILKEYEKRRKWRAERVRQISNLIATIGQLENPFLAKSRDFFMKNVPPVIRAPIFDAVLNYSLGGEWKPPNL